MTVGGKDQLVLAGCTTVTSYDPMTGKLLWSSSGTGEESVGTPVTNGNLIFASGGYPEQDTVALKPDGGIVWRHNVKSRVPSLLVYGDHLYMISDDGIARCYEANSGRQTWMHRIGGQFRVSPVVSGGQIITTDITGKTTVF